ncbi:MAG: DUF2147 domain-containing protein [Alphaproteobacteria bacterium]|nr:DUF2147 domain-containing protein [Alphaproteobacteria bacterium]
MQRGKLFAVAFMVAAIAGAAPASAADMKAMVGTWKWTDYTIQVKECTTNPAGAGLCATVVAGPKNVGMEMFRSKLEAKPDGSFVGKIGHPASGETYNTKMTIAGDVWHMNGCTDAGVCATGDFVRQK